jgi:hypothetical protein
MDDPNQEALTTCMPCWFVHPPSMRLRQNEVPGSDRGFARGHTAAGNRDFASQN